MRHPDHRGRHDGHPDHPDRRDAPTAVRRRQAVQLELRTEPVLPEASQQVVWRGQRQAAWPELLQELGALRPAQVREQDALQVPMARQVSPRARLEQRGVHQLAALRPVHGAPLHRAHDARAVRLER